MILIIKFLFKIQKELCGIFNMFIPIAFWLNPSTFTNMIIYRIKLSFTYIIWLNFVFHVKLPSTSLSFFYNNVLFSFHCFTSFFLIFNGHFWISYFKSSLFNWAFGIKFSVLWIVWIRFFIFQTQFWSESKKLLNFQKPWLLMGFLFFEIEIVTGVWSVDTATKKSIWISTSWRLFKIKNNLIFVV